MWQTDTSFPLAPEVQMVWWPYELEKLVMVDPYGGACSYIEACTVHGVAVGPSYNYPVSLMGPDTSDARHRMPREILHHVPRIYGCPDIRSSGFPDIRKSGYPEVRTSGYPDFRISGCLDFWISEFPEIWVSGNRTIIRQYTIHELNTDWETAAMQAF